MAGSGSVSAAWRHRRVRSRPEAQPVAVNFAVGYYVCTGADRASIITLAIGTTNAGTQVRDNGWCRRRTRPTPRDAERRPGGHHAGRPGGRARPADRHHRQRRGVVVVVALERGDTARFSQRALATPSRSGAVRVVTAHAPLVTLRATSGATFTLDVTALRFV